MRAATSAAIAGTIDGVLGSDPFVVETVCEKLKAVFHMHGASRLQNPLLRPRPNHSSGNNATGGPAEVLNSRGAVLSLPEDLTVSFGTSIVFFRFSCCFRPHAGDYSSCRESWWFGN
jgi:hypothetical protein